MKHTAILLTTLGLLLGSLHAQTVPALISYQGRVTDSSGVGLGTGTPVNRKVIFRIYDAATGGTRLWTEEQTTTLANGEFSILLGNGIAPTGTAAGESRPALDTVFTSGTTDRYIEITVDNGDNTINASDLPIAPRQRITSTAYTLRARSAESIATGTDLQLNGSADYGLGWYGTGRLFNGISVNGPVLYGQAGGALGSAVGATKQIALSWDGSRNVSVGAALTAGGAINGASLNVGAGSINGGNITGTGTVSGASLATAGIVTAGTATMGTGGFAAPGANTVLQVTGAISGGSLNVGTGSIAGGAVTGSSLSAGTGVISGGSLNVTGIVTAGTATMGSGGFATTGIVSAGGAITGSSVSAAGASGHVFTDSGGSNDGLFWASDGIITLNTQGVERARFFQDGMYVTGARTMSGTNEQWGSQSFFIGPQTTVVMGEFDTNGTTAGGACAVIGGHNATRTAWTDLAINPGGGSVGIGLVPPAASKARLHVGIGLNAAKTIAAGFLTSQTPFAGGNAAIAVGLNEVSIYAEKDIEALGFRAFSDERIKIISGVSNGAADLSTLLAIKITDYSMKDKVSKGTQLYKKVIAQQVEQVYPQAVGKTVDVVPDIYQKATINDGWVSLKTDLKKGDRVRLIAEKAEGIHEVLEVTEERFRTAFQPEGKDIFVYGREVKDFRVVDYEAISMLNVSATQQLKKEKDAEVKALQSENAELRARLAKLEAKDKARDAKLAAIEALLSGEKPAVQTVSLQKNQGAE